MATDFQLVVPQATLPEDVTTYDGVLMSGTGHKLYALGQRVTLNDLIDDDVDAVGRKRSGGHAVRGAASLADLIGAGILVPGENKVHISYKGNNVSATLTPDGAIEYKGKRYQSATAFSIFFKRTITPSKLGDDGWKSVLYDGRSLEHYRHVYLDKRSAGAGGSDKEEDDDDDDSDDGSSDDDDAMDVDGAAGQDGVATKTPGASTGKKSKGKSSTKKAKSSAKSTGGGRGRGRGRGRKSGGRNKSPSADPSSASEALNDDDFLLPEPQQEQVPQGIFVDLPAGAEVDTTVESQQWICCDRCEQWRLVPDVQWKDLQENPTDKWFCEMAKWDVASTNPFTPPCDATAGGV